MLNVCFTQRSLNAQPTIFSWFSCVVQPLPWASVHWLVQCTQECHWNATGRPSVHWDTTGRPCKYCRVHWNTTGNTQLKLPHTECHWRDSDYCSLHWNTTGANVAAHIPAYINKHGSTHANLKWQDHRTLSSKWIGLCKFSFYLKFTALQCIPVLLFQCVST